MRIITVPCLKDNYAYLIDAGTHCAVVDPSDADTVTAALKREGLTLTHILNTHHHGDHTDGNLALKAATGALVVGPEADSHRIPGLDIGVGEAAGWEFAGAKVQVLEVPGHTRGAITFVVEGNAFTGDTLFSAGCGRLFEGSPEMMWNSLQKLMRLAGETKVWCGHEYTESNCRFALTLEPDNQALRMFTQIVRKARAAGSPSVPSTIALETLVNPFLRPDSPAIRKALDMEAADDVAVFAETRRRKDNF